MGFNFFTVSLENNIPTLLQSIKKFEQYYSDSTFTILCPEQSLKKFKLVFNNWHNVEIKSEFEVLQFEVFEEQVLKYCKSTRREFKSRVRLSWYYQQILKISYLFQNIKQNKPLVMWDADTIPTKKIKFFEKDKVYLYGSLVEFHLPYFSSLKTIFKELPKQYLAFTVQFFACTYKDYKYIQEKFMEYLPKREDQSISQWIAAVIIQSTYETHNTLDGSLFSEQELIGIACLQRTGKRQHIVRYIRGGLNGTLSATQMKLVKFAGFHHITYENISDLEMRRQDWIRLLLLLIKENIRQLFFAKFIRRKKEIISILNN